MQPTRTTILIVDSDTAYRRRMARDLRDSGFRVLEAQGGREAEGIWLLHQGEIALLVTALALPDRNGYALAEWLRSVEPAIKILFISGPTGAVISEFHARTPGAVTMFRPFGSGDLVRKVSELLKNGFSNAAGT